MQNKVSEQQLDEQFIEDVQQVVDQIILCEYRSQMLSILRNEDMIFLLEEDWVRDLYQTKKDYTHE